MKPKTYCEKWPVGCRCCDLLLCDGKKDMDDHFRNATKMVEQQKKTGEPVL